MGRGEGTPQMKALSARSAEYQAAMDSWDASPRGLVPEGWSPPELFLSEDLTDLDTSRILAARRPDGVYASLRELRAAMDAERFQKLLDHIEPKLEAFAEEVEAAPSEELAEVIGSALRELVDALRA